MVFLILQISLRGICICMLLNSLSWENNSKLIYAYLTTEMTLNGLRILYMRNVKYQMGIC